MTLTTIGYGDVCPHNLEEQLFVIFGMFCGACFFAFVIGSCCTLVESLDNMSLQFQDALSQVSACRSPTSKAGQARCFVPNLLLRPSEPPPPPSGTPPPATWHRVRDQRPAGLLAVVSLVPTPH